MLRTLSDGREVDQKEPYEKRSESKIVRMPCVLLVLRGSDLGRAGRRVFPKPILGRSRETMNTLLPCSSTW